MLLPEPWAKEGDLVEAGKWLKKLGHVKMNPKDNKSRNAYALVQKGKFVLAKEVDKEKGNAETIVNYDGELRGFKKIQIETLVKFNVDRIVVFPIAFWKKATNRNLFLGMLDKEKKDGLDNKLSEQPPQST